MVSPLRIDAEAAAWVARLQGERSQATQAGLQAWLAEDAAHAAAFERATDIWAIIPGAALQGAPDVRAPATRRVRSPLLAVAASVVLVLGLVALWSWSQAGVYATERGEQRVAALEDGSRIALNTDTRVKLTFDAGRRLVTMDRGEAMFEVAHDPSRPFIVAAGKTQVRAIGTRFIVRHTGDDVSVTLLEGKVAVSRMRGRAPAVPSAILSPGERLTAQGEGPTLIDTQTIEAATAWRRGQVVFGDTSLAIAVAELNRYGGPRLMIDDARVATLPVSGVFGTNDAAEFAQAVAALHGLRVHSSDGSLHLTR